MDAHEVSERRAYRALSVNRATFRYEPVYYRMKTLSVRNEGTRINHKRVERIWREKGLNYHKSSLRGVVYGLRTAVASAFARRVRTMFGATIL